MARAAGRYAWLERRLFEVLGGWVPSVAEPEVKLLLRRHSFQHAWHAQLWDPFVPASGRDASAPERLEPVLRAVAAPRGTPERLAGAYGALLPQVVASYRELAIGADGPVARVLRLILADEETALAEATALRRCWEEAGAQAHRSVVEGLLTGTGGVRDSETSWNAVKGAGGSQRA